jgi:hypothetical protein
MKVRATALLARKAMLVRQFGEERVARFFDEFAEKEPLFKGAVLLPVSQTPADAFLRLNDALLATFYEGKVEAYWTFGKESAEWAFKEGPFKALFSTRDYLRFVEMTPAIWKTYFDEGRLEVTHDAAQARVKILDVPIPHLYFEYSVLGFFGRGLELTGATQVRGERIKGFSSGEREVDYRYRWMSGR